MNKVNNSTSILPDFCQASIIYLTIVSSVLLAFLLSFIAPNWQQYFWINLSNYSLFTLWTALSSVALLCLIKRTFNHLTLKRFSIVSIAVTLLVTFVFSLIVGYFLSPEISVWFISRNLFIALIVGGIFFRYYFIQQDSLRRIQSEAEARVQALQSRIRPHFLFNSLNTIANLAAVDPQKTEDSIIDLADIFRASMRKADKLIKFAEEKSLCIQYLNLEQQRLGDKLNHIWQTDTINEDILIPPLLLQPVLENAVLHGIQSLEQVGTICIKGVSFKNHIEIEVSNPVAKIATSVHTGNSLALKNIAQRLEVLYSGKARLKYHQANDTFYCLIKLPKLYNQTSS